MRRLDNPPNRFDRLALEWEVEPPPATLEVYEDTTRRILAENDSPDIGFRLSVNPYRGCSHACAYCYARPSHEYLGFGAGSDFETRILVKTRAPELLRAELSKPGWRGELIAFSGDTDCYQPLEAHYGLTRACLEVCLERSNPVGVITKSYLIARDAELLGAMARRQLVTVAFSIPFFDAALARAIEPGAPRPGKRFEAMEILSRAGVPTRIMVGPIIPGLNDDQIPALLERAKAAGASGASRVLLRLPGAVREVFLTRLQAQLPLKAARVEALVRETRGGQLNDPRFGHRMRGSGAYWEAISRSFDLSCRRLGLDAGERRSVPAAVPAIRAPAQLSLFE